MHFNNLVALPLVGMAAAQYGAAPAVSSAYNVVTSVVSIYQTSTVIPGVSALSSALSQYSTYRPTSASTSQSASASSSTSSSVSAPLSSATVGAGQTLRVNVGQNGQLAYSPNVVSAAPGAKVEFHYFPMNHSVVQSSFQSPCQPLPNGINSGFVPTPNGESPTIFTLTVNDTNPIWLYCAQAKHCQQGMDMVINQPAPPSPNTLQAYMNAAKNVSVTGVPTIVSGGVRSNTTVGGSGTTGGSGGSGSTGTRPPYPISTNGTRPYPTGTGVRSTGGVRPTGGVTPTGPRYTGAAVKENVAGGVVLGAAVGIAGLLL